MAQQNDGLFLLEVLIEKIVFTKSPSVSDKDFRTCVRIQCPSVEPLEICDDDPGSCVFKSGCPLTKTFNNGKSCLFSLNKNDIGTAMNSFPVQVTVCKSLSCGCVPTTIVIGEARIDMTKEFIEARNTFLQNPQNVTYQALKDSFRLVAPDGDQAGDIVMFLRISCFGKLIITRFQGGAGPPNLGGGVTNAGMVERSGRDPCSCVEARGPGAGGSGLACLVHGAGGVCPRAIDPYDSMPCQDPEDPCFCTGPKPPAKQTMVCRNTDQYCLHVPKGRSTQFEEIGSNVGGNELKIKVPASAAIIKKISQTHLQMQKPYTPGQAEGAPCVPPCGRNQISLNLPSEAICCGGQQPNATQFTCTTEGCTQAAKHGQQAAMQRGTGDNKQEPPNRDVFVLKVAKTALHGDKKVKLEVELVTPKGPDKNIPIQKIDTRIQSDLDCECVMRRIRSNKKKHK